MNRDKFVYEESDMVFEGEKKPKIIRPRAKIKPKQKDSVTQKQQKNEKPETQNNS